MSLATRCTACGTVFRVVQDQLKVSEGWVRCGRCNEVFNALEGLFDLERDAPPDWSPIEPHEALAEAPVSDPFDAAHGDDRHRFDEDLLRERSHASTPAMRVGERDRVEFPDARFDSTVDAVDAATEPMSTRGGDEPASVAEEPLLADIPDAPPTFLRYGERRSRPGSPIARLLLSLVTLMLVAVLALQTTHHFRDLLAARWPALRPALTAWCGLAHCSLQPLRRIDDVTVESSALARSPQPDAFKLSVALRNRGATAVALPSVDLSLTDTTGQLVARRVLAPSDFKATAATLAAGADAPLQLVFKAANLRVTGYTVELFYP